MQVNFIKEQQKLLKGLKMKYFQFIMMKCMSIKKSQKRSRTRNRRKKKKRKANKEEQEEIFPVDFDNEAIQKEQDKKNTQSR